MFCCFWSCASKIWFVYTTICFVCTIICSAYISNWSTIWFFVVYRVYCCFSDAFVDNCIIVCWWVVVCSYDCNSVVTCSCCYNYKSDVIWSWPFCCSFDTTCNYWFDYKFDVIWFWFWSCCCNSNTSLI